MDPLIPTWTRMCVAARAVRAGAGALIAAVLRGGAVAGAGSGLAAAGTSQAARPPGPPVPPATVDLNTNRVVNLAWSLLQRQCVVGSSKMLATSVTQCMPMHLKRMSPENYSSERKQKLICFLTISS